MKGLVSERAEKLRKINLNSGKMLINLVNDLLDSFLLKNDKFEMKKQNIVINDLIS